MDGGHSRSPNKRGRGSSNVRGRGNGAARGNGLAEGGRGGGAFNRKLAGTPLFQPASDSEDASDSDVGDGPDGMRPGKAGTSRLRDAATYDPDAEAARKSRFQVHASANRYIELKPLREKERRDAIASGLIPDPLKPRRLDEAITFQGTCMEMCPEFEREEREYQKNVDRWELLPNTTRIDPNRAVKAFHRPAAGNDQPLPSDVRPPQVLSETLDYLFHDILKQDPQMQDSHPFLRDRTRAVRQDFTMQNERGLLAIQCHERIARYHILCLHILRGWENFSESQELEQLRKVLQSLNEFYDDARHDGLVSSDEAEFRAYYLITHLRDSDTIRQTELLPPDVFNSQHVQAALRLHALAQRNNETRGERGRRPANSEASLNAFSRFFKAVAADQSSYLLACLAESHFVDIRRGALVALKKAFIPSHPEYPIAKLAKMLGCDDVDHCKEVVENFGLKVTAGEDNVPASVELHRRADIIEYPPVLKQRSSKLIVEAKRGKATFQDVIDGKFYSAHVKGLKGRYARSMSPAKPLSPIASRAPSSTATPLVRKPVASPPIIAPPTPKAYAAFTSPKMPSSSTFAKLNAAAAAFTPSAFGSQPTPPPSLTSGKVPTPVTTPESVAVVKSQLQTAAKPSASVESRQPLQPRQTPPAVVRRPPSISRKSPAQAAFSTPPAPDTHTHVRRSASIAENRILKEKALPLLQSNILSSMLDHEAMQAAEDVLEEIELERESEWRLLVEQCVSDLITTLLETTAAKMSQEVAATQILDQRVLRARIRQWRKKLETAKNARALQEARRKRFSELARDLRVSPTKILERDSELVMPDIALLELEDAGEAASVLDTSTRAPRSRLEDGFWRPGTLARLLSDRVSMAFASHGDETFVDWKALFVVPDSDASITAWLRCKLDMAPNDEGRILVRRNVRLEFAIVTENDLEDEPLHDAGLVILSLEAPSDASQVMPARLVDESVYVCPCINLRWDSIEGKPLSGFQAHQVDSADVNAGLASLLDDLLNVVRPNTAVKPQTPARDAVKPLLAAFQTSLTRAVTVASSSASLQALLERYIQLLVILQDDMLGFLDTEEPPPFLLSSFSLQAEELEESICRLIEQPQLHSISSIAYLRINLMNIPGGDLNMVATTLRYLADAVSGTYEGVRLRRSVTKQNLQELLDRFQADADDALEAVAKASKQDRAVNGKKRARSSPDSELIRHANSTPKRAKDERPLEMQPQAWVPDKVGSLAKLISETKALLAK